MDRHADINPAEAANARAQTVGAHYHCSSHLTFGQPQLNRLRDLWFEKAAGRPLPCRADFDLRDLRDVLKHLAIVERRGDGAQRRYYIRLMGSEIARLLGEGSGHFLDELIPADLLPRWHAAHDAVLDALVPLRFVAKFELARINYLISECFQAPMLDAYGEPTMLMVCAYFQSRAEHAGP